MGGIINKKTALSSTNHWAEALKRFCITVGGVAAAVSVFVQLNQFSQILSRQCCLGGGGDDDERDFDVDNKAVDFEDGMGWMGLNIESRWVEQRR